MTYFKENFHSHLDYCNHAEGRAIDYINAAQKANFYALGFSDHTPFAYNRPIQYRMRYDQLQTYRDEVREAASHTALTVYLGLELDLEPSLDSFYNDLLAQYPFDYTIGSVHTFKVGNHHIYTPEIETKEEAVQHMEILMQAVQNKRYSFIGHPDRFFYSSYVQAHLEYLKPLWQQFCLLAKQVDCPIEFNTSNDFNLFYNPDSLLLPYWHIVADHQVKVIINSDAHSPEHIDRYFEQAYQKASQWQLNVISFSKRLADAAQK